MTGITVSMHTEIIATTVSGLLIVFYYLYLAIKLHLTPNASVHAFNAGIRRQWVSMIMASGKMDILAVQTLRNSVMAANFMASTSVLLIIGTLNLSEKIGNWVLDKHWFAPEQSLSNQFWQLKLGLLLLDFFIAFFCFSMAIRLFNHVGYMINLPQGTADESLALRTFGYLNRAGRYYTLGNRAFYFSLPVIMWFFGPYFLLLGTVLLVIGLAILDKAPNYAE